MKTLKILTSVLGIVTLIGLFFSYLALTDIYHNTEPNLDTEWNIVKATLLITLLFIITSLITISKSSKE
jgi:hypothetical protein